MGPSWILASNSSLCNAFFPRSTSEVLKCLASNLALKHGFTKKNQLVSEKQLTLELNVELHLLLQPQRQHLGRIRPPQLQHEQHEGHGQRQPRQGHVVPETDGCQGQASEDGMEIDSQVPKKMQIINQQIIIQFILRESFMCNTNCEIESRRLIWTGR